MLYFTYGSCLSQHTLTVRVTSHIPLIKDASCTHQTHPIYLSSIFCSESDSTFLDFFGVGVGFSESS